MSANRVFEFVDTNVLVYAYDQSVSDKRKTALELLQRLVETGIGCLSMQILQEFLVTITRKVALPLTIDQAETTLRTLRVWHIHSPVMEDIFSAIDIQRRYRISFWDAMMIHSAISLQCGILWSEDLHHGQVYQGVQVKNPFLD